MHIYVYSIPGGYLSPFVGRSLADFRISRLRFPFSRLRFAYVDRPGQSY